MSKESGIKTILKSMIHALDKADEDTYFKLFKLLLKRHREALGEVIKENKK